MQGSGRRRFRGDARGPAGRRARLAAAWTAGGLLLLGAAVRAVTRPPAPLEVRAGLTVADVLAGADTAGYARAHGPRPFAFPEDHGPHPEFQSEWWYVTGNLEAADGRRFGFQWTVFRSALAPAPAGRPSAWDTNQAYMGHFAVTDVGEGRHHSFERFARGAAGLAGAQAEPLRVWLEDWELAGTEDLAFPLRLRAADAGVAVDLVLDRGKPPVLQGEEGLSPKGPEPGNASYYYSLTRMPAQGTVQAGGRTFAVRGLAWMDREWSTRALPEDVEGWDWFAVHLDDGRDLMHYQLRRRDGSPHPWSTGTLVAPDGTPARLGAEDVVLEVLARWRSPVDGVSYPSRWRLRVPGHGLDLTITPPVADQELRGTFRYWEGAVEVRAAAAGGSVAGRGFVELTGYAGEGEGSPRWAPP